MNNQKNNTKRATPTLRNSERSYINWLEETLIPDLRDSGSEYTADDFDKCISIIRRLSDTE